MMASKIGFAGRVGACVQRARGPGLRWRLRNMLRLSYVRGWIGALLAGLFSKLTGVATVRAELRARLRRASGEWIDYGVLSRMVVTTAGVTLMATDFKDGTVDITNFKYHGCGTGTTAEAVGDTALVTESTTALNPDSTRASGTNTTPSANVYQSVGTLTFDAAAAITEHGVFSQAAVPGGTLWDRSVFSAINVAAGDSIQFTYALTLTAGG